MPKWSSLILLAGLLLTPAMASVAQAQALSPLTIETGGGNRDFNVEVVSTPADRARGLMHRQNMPQNQGMLFDFQDENPVSFWMKNTLIPLDMIFIDGRGRILRIHHRAIPHDETLIPSGQPVRAVLEINGGLSRLLGIAAGQTIRHDIFDNR